MQEDHDKKLKDQRSWLRQHDFIQEELLKMKEDLLKGEERDDQHRGVEGKLEEETTPKAGTGEIPVGNTSRDRGGRFDQGPTIKELLGTEGSKETGGHEEEKRTGEPPRLKEGQIPVSPDLTSKIANVLQLEDKLKRRKFELEKRASKVIIPPPPREPDSIKHGKGESRDRHRSISKTFGALGAEHIPSKPPPGSAEPGNTVEVRELSVKSNTVGKSKPRTPHKDAEKSKEEPRGEHLEVDQDKESSEKKKKRRWRFRTIFKRTK